MIGNKLNYKWLLQSLEEGMWVGEALFELTDFSFLPLFDNSRSLRLRDCQNLIFFQGDINDKMKVAVA